MNDMILKREVVITSGRMNPGVDPVLHAWGWEIPLYLFLGGLVAGILVFSAVYFIRGKENEYRTAVKFAPLFAPVFLGLGLGSLLLDLTHPLYFWQLFTNIRWESPMSWGAWVLNVIFPLSIIWAATWIKDVFPGWNWQFAFIEKIIDWLKGYRLWMAWVLIFTSVILGVYTGILLSAFNARPFWNTSILGPLFLTSGLSSGAAFIILLSKSHEEMKCFGKIDLILIMIELFLIIHLFMGFLASTEIQIQTAKLFLGGPFTAVFWVLVVGFGLVVPMMVELMELYGLKVPVKIAATLVILGGLLFRFVVMDAGQSSRWLYKAMF